MKVTRIKEIAWWDPKAKQDAVTWKVWVEQDLKTTLRYFTNPKDLEEFLKEATDEPKARPKTKTRSKNHPDQH